MGKKRQPRTLAEPPSNSFSWRLSFIPRRLIGIFLLLIPKDTKNLLDQAFFLLVGLGRIGHIFLAGLLAVVEARVTVSALGTVRRLRGFRTSTAKNVREEGTRGSSGMAAVQFAELRGLGA